MTVRARHLLPASLLFVLLFAGCQQSPVIDGQDEAAPLPMEPVRLSAAPGWLPLHARPRPGDFAVHRQLDREGLTELLRRSEVIRVREGQIEIEQRFNQPGSPRLRYRLDRKGRVLRAWVIGANAAEQPLSVTPEARRSTLRVKDRAPLPLASGNFPVSRIVSQSIQLDDGKAGRQVFYLSPGIPFSTLVSLSSDRPISHKQAVRLLGRIAVPQGSAARPAASGGGTITSGWVLVKWGRGRK